METGATPVLHGASALFSTRQNRLKVRRLFLAGDHADFDFFEARRFEPAMQVAEKACLGWVWI
jgi:hypothetical protein